MPLPTDGLCQMNQRYAGSRSDQLLFAAYAMINYLESSIQSVRLMMSPFNSARSTFLVHIP